MPLYRYKHPNKEEYVVIIQGMNDVHEYFDEKKVKWERDFEPINLRKDSEIDPFSAKQFMDKTKDFKGSLGDLWDMSSELSEKRASKRGGVDEIKEKVKAEYRKKTKKPHPDDLNKKNKLII